MPEGSSTHDKLSVAELAIEVQRLKILIGSCTQAQAATGSQETALLDEPVPETVFAARYGDLEIHTEQTVQYTNGNTYKGETLGTLRHGNGRLTCANGDVYTGQWCYGKREGAGHAVFDRRPSRDDAQPRPVCYNGQWKEDQTHGEGTCTYEDGAVYTGEWYKDQRSGWGKHTFSNKDWYEGEWDADTMHGQGRLTLTDGSFYECSWKAGQPTKKGKWSSADGQTEYEGQFSGKLLRHGFGTLHQTGVRKYMGKAKQPCSRSCCLLASSTGHVSRAATP